MSGTSPIEPKFSQLKVRFHTFVYKLFGRHARTHHQVAANKIDQTVQYRLPHDYCPSQQERDAFRMKAIVLLKEDEVLRTSIPELLKAPIQVNVGQDDDQRWVIKFTQQFKQKSGRTVKLEGRFVRNPSLGKHSIPIPNSFRIVQE